MARKSRKRTSRKRTSRKRTSRRLVSRRRRHHSRRSSRIGQIQRKDEKKSQRAQSRKRISRRRKFRKISYKIESSRHSEFGYLNETLPEILGSQFPPTPDDIILLCLAHNGVSQPIPWRYWWKESRNKENLKFMIHCPNPGEQEINNPDFCYNNRLNLEFRETAWCTPSLVMIYIDAVKYILDSFYIPNGILPRMIYLVSGTDMPICYPDYIFSRNNENKVCIFMKDWSMKDPSYLQSKDSFLRIEDLKSKTYDAFLAAHEQWIALNGESALILSKLMTPDWFKKVNQNFIDLPKDLLLSFCPDEFYIYYALKMAKIPVANAIESTHDEEYCYMHSFKTNETFRSPIEWINLFGSKFIWFNNDYCSYTTMNGIKTNLFNLLMFYKYSQNYDPSSIWATKMFFRKIGDNPYLFFTKSSDIPIRGEDLFKILYLKNSKNIDFIEKYFSSRFSDANEIFKPITYTKTYDQTKEKEYPSSYVYEPSDTRTAPQREYSKLEQLIRNKTINREKFSTIGIGEQLPYANTRVTKGVGGRRCTCVGCSGGRGRGGGWGWGEWEPDDLYN